MNDFTKEAVFLGALPAAKTKLVRSAVNFGAARIKDNWREKAKASSGAHARLYPYKITYDVSLFALGGISAEIGPVAEGQGNLGPVLEFGGEYNLPTLDGNQAVNEEDPKIMRALDVAMAFGADGIFK